MNTPPPALPKLTVAEMEAYRLQFTAIPYQALSSIPQWTKIPIPPFNYPGRSTDYAYRVLRILDDKLGVSIYPAWTQIDNYGYRFRQETHENDGPLSCISVDVRSLDSDSAEYIMMALYRRLANAKPGAVILCLNPELHSAPMMPDMISSAATGMVFYCDGETISTYYRIRPFLDFGKMTGMETLRMEMIR